MGADPVSTYCPLCVSRFGARDEVAEEDADAHAEAAELLTHHESAAAHDGQVALEALGPTTG
jgi:hypothetical protein